MNSSVNNNPVDLSNPLVEPTDEDLSIISKEVSDEAHDRARKNHVVLMARIVEQAQAASASIDAKFIHRERFSA